MKTSPAVRICSAQVAGVWEEPERSLDKAAPLVRHAALSGAALICFPEQFPTGWDPASAKNIQDIEGTIVSGFRKLAQKNRIGIIGSFRQQDRPLPRNTVIVIGSDGQVRAQYSKIHLFGPGNEHAGFSPGNKLGFFSLGSLACGIAICYDLRFPELFRLYAQKAVQTVFVPAAWPAQRAKHWELFITARAAENQMYIVGVNTTGTTPVETYAGGSMTADPHGTIISRADDSEQLVFTDIDPEVIATARRQFPVEKDRKDALYRSLAPGAGG